MARAAWMMIVAFLIPTFGQSAGPQDMRWDENPMIRDAVKSAIHRLEKRPSCASLFGDSAAGALMSVRYRFVRMGKPRVVLGPRITLSVVAAETKRDINVILLNQDGPFVHP